MASHANPLLKYRTESFLSKPVQFQRGKGKIKTKKTQKKTKLKFKHIFLSFLLFLGLFFSIQQFYLFLISWDNLNVKEIEVACRRPEVKKDIQEFLKGKNLGNILLLDIGKIQGALTDFTWIKEVQVRKIFPSSLKIEIQERVPVALLKKEHIYLIDKNGVLLEKVKSKQKWALPLLVDTNDFQKDYYEKLRLAQECLNDLSSLQRDQIKLLDLTDYENVTIQFKGREEKIILGYDQFSQKLKLFQNYITKLEKHGPLEYVDLRFHNRIIYKLHRNIDKNPVSIPIKEAN